MKSSLCRFFLLSLLTSFSAHGIIATNSQLLLGNPSGATTDPNNHNHYLIQRSVEAIDYCDNHGCPNWASWDLTSADVGSSGRSSSFYTDTNLPASFHVISPGTFGGSWDRGHMCPSADRTDNSTDNQLVFFMSNIIPQSSTNNEKPWADLENYTRTLLTTSECCIISGPYLFDGTRTPNNSLVWVPQWTWKIVVVAPLGSGALSNRVTTATRVISIKMTNTTDYANYTYGPWESYITNAHQIELDTGYTFFTALDPTVAAVLRAKIDGAPAPTISSFTPTTGPAGTSVTVNGANFTGVASVLFNNVQTTNFTVNSSTKITVTVPTNATTGTIGVIAAGGLATSSSSFVVGSSGNVVITSQPTSMTANAGATANYSVQAQGNATLTFQWQRNGAALANGGSISGATSSNLTVTAVSQSNAGSYVCLVSNSTSSATSSTATLTVIDPPNITTQPNNATVNAGSSTNFTVVASGTLPTYKWRKNGTTLSDGGTISGSATAILSVTSATSSDAASYSVIVSNAAGSVTSSNAVLTVISAPTISVQPQSATAAIGSTTNFSVTATGTSLTYQWRKNGTALPNSGDYAGVTTSSLTVSPVAAGDVGSYTVVVSNPAGSVTSSVATLNLSGTVAITTQPASQAVVVGADATFSVGATGSGTLGYQWRYNGATIANATDSSFTTNSVSLASAGSYSVVVTNSFSSVTSSDAVLIVSSASSSIIAQWNMNDTNNANFTTSPSPSTGVGTVTLVGGTTASAAAGSSTDTNTVNGGWNTGGYPAPGAANKSAGAQFAVSTKGYENIRVSWDERHSSTASRYVRFQYTTNGSTYNDSQVITVTGTSFVSESNNLASAANVRDNANFAFRLVTEYQSTTGLGSTADFVGTSGTYGTAGTIRYDMVTIYGDPLIGPSIVSQPQSQTSNAGTVATFSVGVAGSATLSYKWLRNNSPLNDGGRISGSTTATLSISSVTDSDAASYSVLVTNSVGSATSAAVTLTVNDPVTISSQPGSRTNVTGTTATFTVTATGTAPQYQWRKNGNVLSNGGNITGATSATLSVANIATTDAGSYSVDVFNFINTNSSSAAILTVVVPPSITTDPTSQTVNAGNAAGFTVVATGTAPLSYQWRRNTSPISGATDSSYNIGNAHQGNAGSYDVVVTNAGSSVTSGAATLTVIDPPSITASPASQTTFAGANVVFTVSASGAGPFTYQWRQDGENQTDGGNIIGSQTSSLTVQNVHDADNGAYSVVVQNAAGTTNSSDASLVVVPFANRLLNISTNNDGTPALLWSVVPGDSYSFEYKDNLTDAQWTSLGTYVPNSSTLAVSDTVTGAAKRFYRLNSAEGVTDVAGFMNLSLLGSSDNYFAEPFVRPSAAVLLVGGINGNVVTLTPSPGWSANQFVYSAGTQTNTYYVRFTTGAAQGRIYPVTANDANSVTLNLGSDTLAGVAVNDSVSIEPYWTLWTVFPNGNGVNASLTTGNRNTEVLAPDRSSTGINLSSAATYYFSGGAWKQFGVGGVHNDDILPANSSVVVRHNIGTSTKATLGGVVVSSKLAFGLRAQTTDRQDNAIGLARPVAMSLNDSGLISSGAFQASPIPGGRTDELLVFDNTVASRNKSASAVFYFWNNAWRQVGLGSTDVGANPVLLPGCGFIIRKATNSVSPVWLNAPNY